MLFLFFWSGRAFPAPTAPPQVRLIFRFAKNDVWPEAKRLSSPAEIPQSGISRLAGNKNLFPQNGGHAPPFCTIENLR